MTEPSKTEAQELTEQRGGTSLSADEWLQQHLGKKISDAAVKATPWWIERMDDYAKASASVRWIPANSGLPEKDKKVWVWVHHDAEHIGGWPQSAALNYRGLWVEDVGSESLVEVGEEYRITHWMPLPSPPEAASDTPQGAAQ
jgi:hypothetical protein